MGILRIGIVGERKKVHAGSFLREVVVVVADGIVLVGAVETFAIGEAGAQRGEVLVVPPGVLHEVHSRAREQSQRRGDAEPAETTANHGGGEKIDEGYSKNRHPTPGELDEAKLWQNVPEDRGEAQHQNGSDGGKEQECAPDFALSGEGGRLRTFATCRYGRGAGEHDEGHV